MEAVYCDLRNSRARCVRATSNVIEVKGVADAAGVASGTGKLGGDDEGFWLV